MGYSRNKLTVKGMKALPAGAHGDGGGLWLRKRDTGVGQWIYRFRLHDRQRQMGLGSAQKVSLAKARELRDKFEAMVVDGKDPVQERNSTRQRSLVNTVVLEDIAIGAFEARKAELRGDGKAGRWFSPLKLHILPQLGKRPILKINQFDIRDTIAPIWHEKADTARKALNRLNITFHHAAALGLDVDMQAVAKAKALLGRQRNTVSNIPAMPWQDVPNFYASLVDLSPVQLALQLLILNPGPRSKPIRFAKVEQMDGDVWTIPGEVMKGTKGQDADWRTPLTRESLDIVKQTIPFQRNGYLFPNASGKGVISDASMSRLMERRGLEYRPHGFRSSFKTWAAETGQDRHTAELCLAHSIYGKVEASYLRTDQLDQRRELMEAWAEFVATGA